MSLERMSSAWGSIGQTKGPSSTASVTKARKPPPQNAPRWDLNWRQISDHCERGGAVGSFSSSTSRATCSAVLGLVASVIADPRVEQAVENVRDQVEEHDQHGEHEGQRLHHRQIVGLDGGDQQLADPVHLE